MVKTITPQFREQTDPEAIAAAALGWYDLNARTLPWRIGPADRAKGVQPDPYSVWLSEIMLQQTTVATVKAYYERFTSKWPTVSALANASLDDVLREWAGLGYYARARNLHKCAQTIHSEHEKQFPQSEAELLNLPGVGAYTSAAIASIAFDLPATVMDGNVERVMARLHAIEDPLPSAKKTLFAAASTLTPKVRAGDYAQAIMDIGATICTPRKPACGICPFMSACDGRKRGNPDELPRKAPKKPKPTRYGLAFVAVRADGAVLLNRRPERGLLGGMMEPPGSVWNPDVLDAEVWDSAPLVADWIDMGEALHTFTHFHLRLRVQRADCPIDAIPSIGRWIPEEDVMAEALPTVMKKVLKLALG